VTKNSLRMRGQSDLPFALRLPTDPAMARTTPGSLSRRHGSEMAAYRFRRGLPTRHSRSMDPITQLNQRPTLRPVQQGRPPRPWDDGALRIGDTERDRTCAWLAEHYAAGRLTADEVDERTDLAVRARTARDLAALTADLPAVGSKAAAMGGVTPAGHLPRVSNTDPASSMAVALFGFLSVSALVCTILLLAVLGMSGTAMFPVAFLAALGASVTTAGVCFFAPRVTRSRATSAGHR
jgi:hypothetical protein